MVEGGERSTCQPTVGRDSTDCIPIAIFLLQERDNESRNFLTHILAKMFKIYKRMFSVNLLVVLVLLVTKKAKEFAAEQPSGASL